MTAAGEVPEAYDSDKDQPSDGPGGPVEEMQDTDIDAYIQLNKELDEINEFLDSLEEKNACLHAELTKLLEESKQIRDELKNEST